MRRMRLVVVAVLALGGSAAAAESPAVAVTGVEFRAAHIRVDARYRGVAAPEFRMVPTCGTSIESDWTVPATARPSRVAGDVTVDLARNFTWLADDGTRPPCRVTGLMLQMLDDRTVVAAAHVPVGVRDGSGPDRAAAEAPAALPRLRLSGQKTEVKPTSRTEAGMLWALSDHLSLQLNFARTANPPTRPQDHEDGFLTRLRLGF
jgi:hypothetical protein